MGSVHSKISGRASSRPRGWQHIFLPHSAPQHDEVTYPCHDTSCTMSPNHSLTHVFLGRSPRKIAITTLRSHRRELDQFSTSKQHASAKRHRQCFCPFRKDALIIGPVGLYLHNIYKCNYCFLSYPPCNTPTCHIHKKTNTPSWKNFF